MVFTRRRLAVCVVGAMYTSAPPAAEGFTPPGCFARLHERGDAFYCAERRLAASDGPAGGRDGDGRGRRTVARCTMASSSRMTSARPGVVARPGAAKAAAAVARKRGRNRKQPSPPPAAVSNKKAGGAAAAAVGRFDGRADDQQQLQVDSQATAAVKAAVAVANPPPPAKGFRRRSKNNTSKRSSNASAEAGAGAGPASSTPKQPPLPPSPPAAFASSSSSAASSSSSSSVDSLGAYFKTLKKIKLLKPDEEVVLGRRIQRGLQLERVRDRLESNQGVAPTCEEWAATLNLTKEDMLRELAVADKAKEHMISANLRLVVSMARNYQYRGLALPDLIQEGTMGLVKATEKFNPEMGFKFNTYATWWIKQSILTGIANQSRVIRLPTQVHAFLSSIRKYTYELTVDGKVPTDEELGDKIGATVQKIQHYRKAALRTDSVSLESRQGNKQSDGVADELGNQIGDTRSPEPEAATQAFYMKGKVTALLATLKEKERKVVKARYGLDGATSKTLEEIGREMGFTRERVRQIEAKALSKLRQPYRNYRVREHKTGQIFVDAGLREPASEAVSAARALIAEAEGLERQQPAVAAARVEQPAVAAAGDRPLKIEFAEGVDASESTQAVEAVLVAALDRTPAAAAAAPKVRREKKPLRMNVRSPAKRSGDVAEQSHPADPSPAGSTREGMTAGLAPEEAGPAAAEPAQDGNSAGVLGVPGVSLSPDSRRLLLDIESQQGVVVPDHPAYAEANRLEAGRMGTGPDQLVDGEPERSGAAASDPSFAVEPLVGAGVDLPAARLTPEEQRRALEIESKRKSLDKAWNKKSEAAVDRLERELAQSAAALALLEGEQEEWERSMGGVVEKKSLSMASL